MALSVRRFSLCLHLFENTIKKTWLMDITHTAEFRHNLEQFRHLLFHLQMECGSVHHILQFFKEEKSMEHFDTLKELDPKLMSQLLAREYVLEARNAPDTKKARQALETALELDPFCPEACIELASLSDSPEAAMMWYQKSMDATTALLGDERLAELFQKFKAKPWQQVETHTYFKAKICLAEKLFRNGYYEVACLHFQELLDLNPTDDLNLRHYLMVCFLCENKLKEAGQLNGQFRGDCSARWYYCKAFLYFKQEGDSRKSRRALHRAFRRNLWTPVYLLGLEDMPDPSHHKNVKEKAFAATGNLQQEPAFKEGSRKEAVDCVQCVAPVFCEDSKLVLWVWEVLKSVAED